MTTFESQRCARRKCQIPFLGETQGSVSLDNRGGMVLCIIENTCSLVASHLLVSVLRAGVTFTFFHLTLYYFTWHSIEHLGYLVRMFRRWLMQGRFDGSLWRALASQFHFKGRTYSLVCLAYEIFNTLPIGLLIRPMVLILKYPQKTKQNHIISIWRIQVNTFLYVFSFIDKKHSSVRWSIFRGGKLRKQQQRLHPRQNCQSLSLYDICLW